MKGRFSAAELGMKLREGELKVHKERCGSAFSLLVLAGVACRLGVCGVGVGLGGVGVCVCWSKALG